MKKLLVLLNLQLVFLVSCNNLNIHQLKSLDNMVLEMNSLRQFTSLQVSRTTINYKEVCYSEVKKCEKEGQTLKSYLNELDIGLNLFQDISSRMNELGLVSYFSVNGFSLWVEGGAFGEIYGYAINHGNSEITHESFKVDNRYDIIIGKKITENVYHFKGN